MVNNKDIYTYSFGIKNILIGCTQFNKDMCYMSEEIDLGEIDDNTVLQLSADYSVGINGSIEFCIEDSLTSKPILQLEEKKVIDEKIFNGLRTRFAIDTNNEVIIKKNGIVIDKTLDDIIETKDNDNIYTVSYTPINPYNITVNNSTIRVKVILRSYETTSNTPYISKITIRKYGGTSIWK